ncbi:hypothetical protein [Primorskyibacter sp. S87]|uniref:hypothetical protein n=1 Tax=Primorskyibacter sp. S87 TaxID=3415126 RepID=UPI003C7BFCB3
MTALTHAARAARIVEVAERYFGRPVSSVSAPGGAGRSSLRLHFDRMDVIGTLRQDFRRTHLEAHVLRQLGELSEDLPECIGVVDNVLFQSDVGKERLGQAMARSRPSGRLDLAARAVSALFRLQSAARKTNLQTMMPHLGANDEWVAGLVGCIRVLSPFGPIPTGFDRSAACEAIAVAPSQFVKWDCRSGNAALNGLGRLRWFDFEYSGLRHGAEDFAWLIGDETLPVAPDQMVDVMIDCWDPGAGRDIGQYFEFLSIYLTFHAAQRLTLILGELECRGWLDKEHILELDDAGVHPDFLVQICGVGRYFSEQTRLTAPLAPLFEAAGESFRKSEVAAGTSRTAPLAG